VTALHLAK